jgi:hypothetical protein
VRRKSVVGWGKNSPPLAGRRSTAVAREEGGTTTRRGDYEGSWDDRERPSFFSRLRSVLG